MSKLKLSEAYGKTMAEIKERKYTDQSGKKVSIPGLSSQRAKCKYDPMPVPIPVSAGTPDRVTTISVQSGDILEAAKRFGNPGATLIMVSKITPTGGSSAGLDFMEERICRRSSLSYSLYSLHESGRSVYGWQKEDLAYPLNPGGTIYTPVTVWKDQDNATTEPYTVTIIATPGVCSVGTSGFEWTYKRSVKSLLRTAANSGHTKIALAPLGCLGFNNSASVTATAIKELLTEDPEFSGIFTEVSIVVPPENDDIYWEYKKAFGLV